MYSTMSSEQEMLRDSVRRTLERSYPFEARCQAWRSPQGMWVGVQAQGSSPAALTLTMPAGKTG